MPAFRVPGLSIALTVIHGVRPARARTSTTPSHGTKCSSTIDRWCMKPHPQRTVVDTDDLVRRRPRLDSYPESYRLPSLIDSDWAHSAPTTSLDNSVSAKYATSGDRSSIPPTGGSSRRIGARNGSVSV